MGGSTCTPLPTGMNIPPDPCGGCPISEVPPDICALAESDFYLARFRYLYPRPYTRDEYEHIYDWMVSWGLLAPDSTYEKIVDSQLTGART